MHKESLFEVRRAVRYILGELSGPDDAVFVEDGLIDEKTLEALRFVKGHADVSLMDADVVVVSTSDGSQFVERKDLVDGYTVGVFSLKGRSFYRLLGAWYEGWSWHLDTPVYENDKDYMKLYDPVTTGTPLSPKVSLVTRYDESGEFKEVRLYTKPKPKNNKPVGLGLAYLRYVETPSLTGGEVRISEYLVDALHYYTAGLCLMALSDGRSEELMSYALGLMGVSVKGQTGEQKG